MTTGKTMPSVPGDFVALAGRIAARLGRPRVRALHRPPLRDAAKNDAEFCAVELDGGGIGFSYALLAGVEAMPSPRDARAFEGIDAATLAQSYAGSDPVAKALGFAAINALSQMLFARAGWMPPAVRESLGLAPGRGEHVGMIGLFPPLVLRVADAGARLTVLELRPELAREHERFRVTLDPAALASCVQVASTCAVLLNDTLDDVLAACRNARHFAVIGPTAGCVPDPLFARGVDAVGGRRIIDADGFRDAFARGDKWGAFAEKYLIARSGYPGVERLLERAGAV